MAAEQMAAIIMIGIGVLVAFNSRRLAGMYREGHSEMVNRVSKRSRTIAQILKKSGSEDTRCLWIVLGSGFVLVGLGILSGFLR